MKDFRIEVGDIVMLNSLTDFSEDQGQRDWTDHTMHNTLLTVDGVSNGEFQQILVDESSRYYHAANRFMVEVKE